MTSDKERDPLIWKALTALQEITEEARHRPVQPTFALRFILAYLFKASAGERWPYDGFWRDVQLPAPSDGRLCPRGMLVHTGMEAIVRSLGLKPQAAFGRLADLRERQSPAAIARRRAAQELPPT